MRQPEAFLIRACARLVSLVLALSSLSTSAQVRPSLPPAQIVNQMVEAETAAKEKRQHFLYRREERSARTKGHLWDELVVETTEGRMHRLIAVDGKPLSSSEQAAEDKRITKSSLHRLAENAERMARLHSPRTASHKR
jgi:hypothetical protein